MNRKKFIESLGISAGVSIAGFPSVGLATSAIANFSAERSDKQLSTDVVIAGGGVGGCAAALSCLRNNLSVILTEETDWIGGQLSQQGVPPDEHPWIETHGATVMYRDFRNQVRQYYKTHYPLTDAAREKKFLNPGNAVVSELSHEPRVALAVLYQMFMPFISSGKLIMLLNTRIVAADVTGSKVQALKAVNDQSGNTVSLVAPYFVDATELGDVLPITGTEYITGAESKSMTGELHAPEKGDENNVQAFTVCFAMDYVPGGNHLIDKPAAYHFWKTYIPPMKPAWPGKQLQLLYPKPATLVPTPLGFHPEGHKTGDALNLWNYRRILSKDNFQTGKYAGDICTVNWPQNDYIAGNLIGANRKQFKYHVERAKQLSLSLLYWLQTEAPRPDGGVGWKGLRLRPDIMGTRDGLAKYPYIREARRIKALFTIKEEHVGAANRELVYGKEAAKRSADFYDSVGVGSYHIDLHPSTGGNNYIDFGSLPFEIPLGALIPERMDNLLPANKNIGTTHITNGCYRLHPVEWNIGESVGLLASYAITNKLIPRAIRENKKHLDAFQVFIEKHGVERKWPI